MNANEIRNEYQNNKNFYDKLFDEITNNKHKECIHKDKKGNQRFDYLKMSKMYHDGDW